MATIYCGKPHSTLPTESDFTQFEKFYLWKWTEKCYYVSIFYPQLQHIVYTTLEALQSIGENCDTIIVHNGDTRKIYMFLNSIVFIAEFEKV